MEVGKEIIIYLSLHCHHQNDSRIKMGSDESHFNVSYSSYKCAETSKLNFVCGQRGRGGGRERETERERD